MITICHGECTEDLLKRTAIPSYLQPRTRNGRERHFRVNGKWVRPLIRVAPPVVHRTARCGLRVTRAQRNRLFGLLRSPGEVWCAVLELNQWRRRRQDAPLAGYQELCRELAVSGPGTFGELDSAGARSVLRRYSGAWFATAARRKAEDASARFPRRRRGLVPVRWYAGTFTLDGRVLRLPTARDCPPLVVRLDREVPYPAGQVRSVTLGFDAGRLLVSGRATHAAS
jgi:hypothetical protein